MGRFEAFITPSPLANGTNSNTLEETSKKY